MSLPFLSNPNESCAPTNGVEWAAGLSFAAYGTRFGLRAPDSGTLARALLYLPHGWQAIPNGEVGLLYSLHLAPGGDHSGVKPHQLLYAGSELIASGSDEAAVLGALASHAQLATAQYAQDFVFVHAGVVAYKGRALLIPGRSRAGKSSLVRALVNAGATYLSDEFAVLDHRGWAHPYALPLSIRAAGGVTMKIPIERLGGQPATEPAPAALILVTEYRPHAHWRPKSLSSAQGLLALMANTVAAQYAPQLVMPVLRETVLRARIVRSVRGEASRIAPALLNLLIAP